MKTLSVAAVVVLLALVVIPTEAQMDLAKGLVGKWEGEYERPQVRSNPKKGAAPEEVANTARTLIIGQVREQGGKWIVEEAKYGITGKQLDPVTPTLEVAGGSATVQFRSPSGEAVKLQLSKDKLLAGTVVVGTGVFHKMELKKVD